MRQDQPQSWCVSPILASHVAAGTLAILAGATASWARKGSSLHRASGDVFGGAMAMMSVLGVILAFVTPQAAMATPQEASASVGLLTGYLVATGWLTGRSQGNLTMRLEILACAGGVAITLLLLGLGLHAAGSRAAWRINAAPYFVFASFSALGASMDVRWLTQRSAPRLRRLSRHLWRMCFAFFFATSFFFIGQQRTLPPFLHGSPILFGLGFAPLALMMAWLFRLRLIATRSAATAKAS